LLLLTTWVWHPLPDPRNLGLERCTWPKSLESCSTAWAKTLGSCIQTQDNWVWRPESSLIGPMLQPDPELLSLTFKMGSKLLGLVLQNQTHLNMSKFNIIINIKNIIIYIINIVASGKALSLLFVSKTLRLGHWVLLPPGPNSVGSCGQHDPSNNVGFYPQQNPIL
jgi:hypothetical protein